jgi:cold shock protein
VNVLISPGGRRPRSRDLHYPCSYRCFAVNEHFHTQVGFREKSVEAARAEWFNGTRPRVVFLGCGSRVEEEVQMALGTVKWFNDAKGYGFISRADDGKDVFVHYSSISGDGFRTLNQGQNVEYEEQQGPKGLFAARVLKVLSS